MHRHAASHQIAGRPTPSTNPTTPSGSRNRPNRLGLCTCEVVAVDDRTIRVRGLDAIDGTPVLDLKPYLAEFAPRRATTQPAWSHELMAEYF